MFTPPQSAALSLSYRLARQARNIGDLAATISAGGYPGLASDVRAAGDLVAEAGVMVKGALPPGGFIDDARFPSTPAGPLCEVRPPNAFRVRPRVVGGVERFQVIAERGRIVHSATSDHAARSWITEQAAEAAAAALRTSIMSPAAFRLELEYLELSDQAAARFLDCDARNIRRWTEEGGDGPPRSVALTLRLMGRLDLSPADALALIEPQ